MRKFPRRAAVLFLGALLALLAFIPLALPSPMILPLSWHPAQATVKVILGEGGMGSGIPVDVTPEGFTIVLTAKHVVEGAAQATMSVQAGEVTLPVTRVEQHATLDIAAIWVQMQLPVVRVDGAPIAFGERLQGAGFLFGDQLQLAEGLVSIPGHFSIDILPGCSGGPVLREGRVVGILVQCIVANSPFGGMPVGAQAIFVQISEARDWLSGILR